MGDKEPNTDPINTDGPPESPKVGSLSSSKNPLETTKQASEIDGNSDDGKIQVFFRHTSNAPIMKKSKWKVQPTSTVSDCIGFIRRYLDLDAKLSIFLYVNQSFAPSLDQTIQNLFDCYETDKKLVLYYATTQAWG